MHSIKLQPAPSLYNLALDSVIKSIKTTEAINDLLLPKQIKKEISDKYILTRVLTLADACKYRDCDDIKFTYTDIPTLMQQNFKVSPNLLTSKDRNRLNNLMGVLLESEDPGLVKLGIELLKNNKTEANIKKFLLCCRQFLKLDVNDIISNLQVLFVNDRKIEKRIIGYIICCELYPTYSPSFINVAKKNKILNVVNYFLTTNNSKLTVNTATALLYCLEEKHDIAQTARTRILQHYKSQLQNKEVHLTKVNSSEDCVQQLPQHIINRLTNVALPLNEQLKLNSVIMSQLSDQPTKDIAIYYQKNSNEIFNLTSITKYLTHIKYKANIYNRWINKYNLIRLDIADLPYGNLYKTVSEFKEIICFLFNKNHMYNKDVEQQVKTIFKELVSMKGSSYNIIVDNLKNTLENADIIQQTLESLIYVDTTITLNMQKLNAKTQELKIVLDKNHLFDKDISVEQLLEIYGFIRIKTELLNNYFWDNIFLKTNEIKYCLIKKAYGKSGVCSLKNYDDVKALISYKTKIKKAVIELDDDKEVQLEKDIIKTVLNPNASVITRIELKQAFDYFINDLTKNKDTDESDTD